MTSVRVPGTRRKKRKETVLHHFQREGNTYNTLNFKVSTVKKGLQHPRLITIIIESMIDLGLPEFGSCLALQIV